MNLGQTWCVCGSHLGDPVWAFTNLFFRVSESLLKVLAPSVSRVARVIVSCFMKTPKWEGENNDSMVCALCVTEWL